MAEITYLAPGENPPQGEKYMLYEWKPDGEMESEQIELIGSRHRVPDRLFDDQIAKAPGAADFLGYQKIYVRGRPA